jgi:hypothetical protein
VHASERWDGRVFAFQVTDFKPDCVEIRILASALNASVTFDLRCEIREQLLSFLQARYPGAFRRPAHLLVAFVRWPAGRNRRWPNQRPVFSDRASVSCHQRKKGHK